MHNPSESRSVEEAENGGEPPKAPEMCNNSQVMTKVSGPPLGQED